MKRLLTLGIVLAASGAALGQTGEVSGKNWGFVGPRSAPVYEPDGKTLVPAGDGRVEILYKGNLVVAAPGGSIVIVADGTGNRFAAAGLFALGVLNVPGTVSGDTVTLVVRVWDRSTGLTFATAGEKASESVQVTLGGNRSTPPGEMTQLQPFVLAPEPGAGALGLLGLGGLWAACRSKVAGVVRPF